MGILKKAVLLAFVTCLPLVWAGQARAAFFEQQLHYPRVRQAYNQKKEVVQAMYGKAGLKQPPGAIFLRVYKKERRVQVWARPAAGQAYILVTEYDICALSGSLGPKRKQGDGQIPEGFYRIDRFNPASNFHLSLGINYPNRSDRILSDRSRPGGDIFIHGSCVTIGCVPITDDKIKELYIMAAAARSRGQRIIPVHMLPSSLDDLGFKALSVQYRHRPELVEFWKNLKQGVDFFSQRRRLPNVGVDKSGRYTFK